MRTAHTKLEVVRKISRHWRSCGSDRGSTARVSRSLTRASVSTRFLRPHSGDERSMPTPAAAALHRGPTPPQAAVEGGREGGRERAGRSRPPSREAHESAGHPISALPSHWRGHPRPVGTQPPPNPSQVPRLRVRHGVPPARRPRNLRPAGSAPRPAGDSPAPRCRRPSPRRPRQRACGPGH